VVNPLGHADDDDATPRLWINLFPIENQADLIIRYRLFGIRDLPRTTYYDKNINLLKKHISYAVGAPTAIVRQGADDYLAIPEGVKLSSLEYPLTPHVATLTPEGDTRTLQLERLEGIAKSIAVSFLYFAFSAPLRADPTLWGHGRAYYAKSPLKGRGPTGEVDVFPGFAWNVVVDGDGRLLLSVDTHVKYVDQRSLSERIGQQDGKAYAGRRCLYRFGHQWYLVQFLQLTGRSIADQKFQPDGADDPFDVYTYTTKRWRDARCEWVQGLDRRSPAILYRAANDKDRYGAAALAWLALPTAHAEASGLHRLAIVPPRERFQEIRRLLQRHFRGARLNGREIQVVTTPLEVPRRVFAVPPVTFGQRHTLAATSEAGTRAPAGAEIVPLETFGRRRLQLVLDPEIKPVDLAPFDAQYLLLPMSAPRQANETFAHHFERTMKRVSGDPQYAIRWILYEDQQATSLHRQLRRSKKPSRQMPSPMGTPCWFSPNGHIQACTTTSSGPCGRISKFSAPRRRPFSATPTRLARDGTTPTLCGSSTAMCVTVHSACSLSTESGPGRSPLRSTTTSTWASMC